MSQKPCVLLLGTCNTKLNEFKFMKKHLEKDGEVKVILADVGRRPLSDNDIDIGSSEVLSKIPEYERGSTIESLSRGDVITLMTKAATALVQYLHRDKSIHGMVSLGGSGGTSIAAGVMRASLPFGSPKLIVSTVASGDTSSFIRESDIMMIPSIVDIAGLNSLLKTVLENAAAAIKAMAKVYFERSTRTEDVSACEGTGKKIAISILGVTTPGVTAAMDYLNSLGHEVFVFHATGTGDRAMERLITEGQIEGVLDLTTTELADELVRGVMSAGSSRLTAAAKHGLPQIVGLGALDMVNFGARSSVPEKFAGRLLVEHNSSITLMRTTPEECKKLGGIISRRLKHDCKEIGKAEVLVPLEGISMMTEKEGKFYHEEADAALFTSISKGLEGSVVKVQKQNLTINGPQFTIGMAKRLLEMMAVENA